MRRFWIALVVATLAVVMASPAKAITNGEPDQGRHPYVGLAVFVTPTARPIGAAPACCHRPWS